MLCHQHPQHPPRRPTAVLPARLQKEGGSFIKLLPIITVTAVAPLYGNMWSRPLLFAPFPPSASIFRTFFKYHGRIAFFAYTKTASRGNTGTRSAGDRTEIGVFPVSACSSRKSRNTTRQPALLWPDGEHCLLASGRPSLRSGRAQNKRKPKRVYSPGGASSGVPGRGVAEKLTFFALVALMSIIE